MESQAESRPSVDTISAAPALQQAKQRFLLVATAIYSIALPLIGLGWYLTGLYDNVFHIGLASFLVVMLISASAFIHTWRNGYNLGAATAFLVGAHAFPSILIFVFEPNLATTTVFFVLAIPTLYAGFLVRPWAAMVSATWNVAVAFSVATMWIETSAIDPIFIRMATFRATLLIGAAGILSWYYLRWLESTVAALSNSIEGERQSAEQLVQSVNERERLQGQLRQKVRMESLGRLAGGVAHDFNNLLTVIISNANMMAEHEDMREEALEIEEAGKQAARMTHQLLAFSRRQVLAPQLINLNKLFAKTEPIFRRLIRSDVNLNVQTRIDLPAVELDSGQMEQVLVNLVTNAHEAIDGVGNIDIKLDRTTDQDGDWVTIDVIDDGEGIAPEHLDHVFEPFFTTRTESGTGLGMATVHGIVTQSQGQISIDSTRGEGTHISIRFPAKGHAPIVAESLTKHGSGGRDIVLLVDDAPAIRHVGQRILQRAGYRVKTAANGREALSTLEETSSEIAWVVSDIVMPEMGGLELANHVNERWPQVHVLLMTGYSETGIEGRAVLSKPFTPQTLREAIQSVSSGKDSTVLHSQ